jgi:hypothetical protein
MNELRDFVKKETNNESAIANGKTVRERGFYSKSSNNGNFDGIVRKSFFNCQSSDCPFHGNRSEPLFCQAISEQTVEEWKNESGQNRFILKRVTFEFWEVLCNVRVLESFWDENKNLYKVCISPHGHDSNNEMTIFNPTFLTENKIMFYGFY